MRIRRSPPKSAPAARTRRVGMCRWLAAGPATLPATRPDRRQLPLRSEDVEGATLIEALRRVSGRVPDVLRLLHVPNGGRRDAVTGARLKAQGVRAGVPDYFLPVLRTKGGSTLRWPGLWIELKAEDGRVSTLQDEEMRQLVAEGYLVIVAWGWEAAYDAVLAYLRGGFGP